MKGFSGRPILAGRLPTALTRHLARSAVRSGDRESKLEEVRRQLLADPSLSQDERSLLERVSLACHPLDTMSRRGNAAHYLEVGLATIDLIDSTLLPKGDGREIQMVLDMGCGFGRILRFLRARFPSATVVACDIDGKAVRFCAQAFSAVGIQSTKSFQHLRLPGAFDLIWSGSLLTHLDPDAAARLLRFFYQHLSPDGLCIFTTHGARSAEWIRSGFFTYKLSPEGQTRVLAGYGATGYGFAEYGSNSGYGTSAISLDRIGRPRVPHYGVSVMSPEAVARLAHPDDEWQHLLHVPHGWDWKHHQDVYVWTRARNN